MDETTGGVSPPGGADEPLDRSSDDVEPLRAPDTRRSSLPPLIGPPAPSQADQPPPSEPSVDERAEALGPAPPSAPIGDPIAATESVRPTPPITWYPPDPSSELPGLPSEPPYSDDLAAFSPTVELPVPEAPAARPWPAREQYDPFGPRRRSADRPTSELPRPTAPPSPPIERVAPGETGWRPSDDVYQTSPGAPGAVAMSPVPVADTSRRRRRGAWVVPLLSGLLGALLTAGVLWLAGTFDEAEPPPAEAGPPQTVIERIRTEIVNEGPPAATAEAVARKVVPSVVTVEIGLGTPSGFDTFGSGSGVVLTGDGLIATNHHVVEDAEEIRTIFQDGRIYDAVLVGSDSLTDLAVLRITAVELTPIELGATENLEIGNPAIAVGNPLGLNGGASLTVGVLSAFNREVVVGPEDRLFGMLQTDAPITQGSSGGALVDRDGKLIGITTAIGVSSAGAEGIGFAIPVELVQRITEEIIEKGRVHHAFLGVQGQDFLESRDDGATIPAGALITGFAGSPSAAEDAGLQAGDRIVRFDDTDVQTMQDLVNGLRHYRVGAMVEFEVVRDGETITATVELGERPDDV